MSPNFQVGEYMITLRILRGYLVAHAPDFGITVTRRFDEIRKKEEVGELYFDLLERIIKDIDGRKRRKERIPEPIEHKALKDETDPKNYRVRDVARLLEVSEDTVRRLSDSGALPYSTTPGGHRRYRRSDVVEWLESKASANPDAS
jgi:excisionase family DNA binding protein